MPDYPAKTVVVDKIFRARCTVGGCVWRIGNPWHPGEYATHAEASAERQRHLDWHNRNRQDVTADA